MTGTGGRRLNIIVVLKCKVCKRVSGESGVTKAAFRKLHENCM